MGRAWLKMSARERRLLTVTAALAAVAVAALLCAAASRYLDALDATIDAQQEDLIYYAAEAARQQAVEAAFAEMAEQHSSRFTQEEIHDALGREIHALSLRGGAPGPNADKPLVDIPSLPYGHLNESGEGHREYQITFSGTPTAVIDLALFLQRLQESPQALRIDNLTVVRNPAENTVKPTFVVTRTIIDDAPVPAPSPEPREEVAAVPDVPAGPNLAANAGFEEWTDGQFPNWEADQCEVARDTQHATEGNTCLRIVCKASEGRVFQRRRLAAGKTFDLFADVSATGAAWLAVLEESTVEYLRDPVLLENDGAMRRYHIQFTVSDREDTESPLCAPCFLLQQGTTLHVDNIVIAQTTE